MKVSRVSLNTISRGRVATSADSVMPSRRSDRGDRPADGTVDRCPAVLHEPPETELHHAPASSGSGTDSLTIAFHFRFIMPGEWRNDISEAVRLLMLVLRALREELNARQTTEVRLGKLFYTQHVGGDLETMWRKATLGSRVVLNQAASLHTPEGSIPLDRIYVVSLTGVAAKKLDAWSNLVAAAAGGRLLFTLMPSPCDPGHRAMYFGGWSALIGRIEGGGRFEQEFGSVEFEPKLSQALRRDGLQVGPSRQAVYTYLDLID